jgi:hypothetical protein
MNIKYGITDEAYKFYSGIFFDSSVSEIRTYPKELWEKYKNVVPVPYGRELYEEKSIELVACRNDFVSFQVGINCDQNYFVTNDDRTALYLKRGYISIRAEVECDNPDIIIKSNIEDMVIDDNRSSKCDILLSATQKEYDAYETAMLFFTLQIPKSCKKGTYKGKVRLYSSIMFDDEEICGEVDFSVRVYDVVLKDKKDSRFYLNLWQHNSVLAKHLELARYSDEHFKAMESYIKSLADLGQRCVTIIASDVPWAGQYSHRSLNDFVDVYEYNMAKIYKRPSGEFIYDFSVIGRYIELCFKYGIDKFIEVYGLCCVWQDHDFGLGKFAKDHPDGIKLRYMDPSDGCMKTMRSGKEIDDYIKALHDYFIEKGYIDKVSVVADEPLDHDLYKKCVNHLKEIAPKFVFSAAINTTSHVEEFKNTINNYCVILPSAIDEYDNIQRYRNEYGKIFTWYVCCWPLYPNMFISSNLLETRLIGYLTYYLNLDGFLRWDYTVWTKNPRKDVRWHTFHAGDANFVYPNSDGSVLLSLRYMQILRGVNDYILAEMAEENGIDIRNLIHEQLLKIDNIKQMFSSKTSVAGDIFNLDYTAFENIKISILEKLEKK